MELEITWVELGSSSREGNSQDSWGPGGAYGDGGGATGSQADLQPQQGSYKHHKKKQQEKEQQEREEALRNLPPAQSRPQPMGPGPRFSPRERFPSPRQQGVYSMTMTRASSDGPTRMRHEPYPRPMKRPLSFDPQQTQGTPSQSSRMPTSGQVINLEADDSDDDSVNSSAQTSSGDMTCQTFSPSHTDSSRMKRKASDRDHDLNITHSSVSNAASDLNRDTEVSGLIPPSEDSSWADNQGQPGTQSSAPQTPGGSSGSGTGLDSSVGVKVEPITESEMELEITWVELGSSSREGNSQDSWGPGGAYGDGGGATGSQADLQPQQGSYKHHKKKQQEKEEKEQQEREEALRNLPPAQSRPQPMGPGPRFSPRERFPSPRQQGVYSMTMLRASSDGPTRMRHEPYPRPTKRPLSFDPQQTQGTPSQSSQMPTSGQVINLEADDSDDDSVNSSAQTSSGDMTCQTFSPSHTDSSRMKREASDRDHDLNSTHSSVSNAASDLNHGTGFSGLIPPSEDSSWADNQGQPGTQSSAPQTPGGSSGSGTGLDSSVGVKVEPITESEMELEITWVELGSSSRGGNSQDSWGPGGAYGDGGGATVSQADLQPQQGSYSLKHVSDDMKTHKNPALMASTVDPRDRTGPKTFKAATQGPSPVSPEPMSKPAAPTANPSVLELRDKKWMVEYQVGNKGMIIEDTNIKQTVYLYKCQNSTLQVMGKVYSITVDSCKKVAVEFESVVSSIEFVNSQSIQAKVMGKCPTVSIDNTDSCKMHLSNDSLDAKIVTAKSSKIKILVPTADGRWRLY